MEAERALQALRTGSHLNDVIVRCYIQMSQALQKEQEIELEQTMTAREFEHLLEARGIPYAPVHQLTQLFEAARYGFRQLGQGDEQKAFECLNAILSLAAPGDNRIEMKITRRTSLIIILLGLSLLLGILFHSFILDNIIKPVAVLLWVFRRILLSVNQEIYWGVLIFLALVIAFVRWPRSAPAQESPHLSDSNATLIEINSWRTSIWMTSNEIDKFNILKQNLGWTLASLYASNQPGKALWEIYEALKQQQISLPPPIYDFLFRGQPAGRKRSFRQMIQMIRRAPGKWISRWTGRDQAGYYRSIEAVLTFMESLEETNHDDRHFDTSFH